MTYLAFLTALQHRLRWENDSKYSYAGTLIEREGLTTIAFNMNDGRKIRIRNTTAKHQCGGGSNTMDAGGGERS
jgi:hypothetical protein